MSYHGCHSCNEYPTPCCEPIDFCPPEPTCPCLPPIVVPCVTPIPTPAPTPQGCVYDCSPPLWQTWPNIVIQNCIAPCGVAPTPDCCGGCLPTPAPLPRCNGGCL